MRLLEIVKPLGAPERVHPPAGRTVLITIEDLDGVAFEGLVREAQPMLGTWAFPPP